MSVIQFQQLSMAEAERCVAEIWTCLEEYDIPSPALSFEFCDRLRTNIRMHIDDPVAANTMLSRLSAWIKTKRSRFGGYDKVQPEILTRPHVAGTARETAPLSFVIAATAPPRSNYAVSRFKRK